MASKDATETSPAYVRRRSHIIQATAELVRLIESEQWHLVINRACVVIAAAAELLLMGEEA